MRLADRHCPDENLLRQNCFHLKMNGSKPALNFAYAIKTRGGRMGTGGLRNQDAALAIPAALPAVGEHTLQSCYIGACQSARDISRLSGNLQTGKLPIKKPVTHRNTLYQIKQDFGQLATSAQSRTFLCSEHLDFSLKQMAAPV
jgi:Zn-dependent alcohol dehydrogenase